MHSSRSQLKTAGYQAADTVPEYLHTDAQQYEG